MRFSGKVALVTGAASGIGKRIAECFAAEGAKIVLVDRDAEGNEATAQKIRQDKGEVLACTVDITEAGQVQQMVETVLSQWGRIDILCNNAGQDQHVVPIAEMDVELWDKIMMVNAKGTFLCSRFVLPSMISTGEGVIVNVASDLGYIVVPGLGAYCSSKGAVLQLTRVMAAENGPYNIRVNALCPTMVDTPMARRTVATHPDPDGWMAEIADGVPLRRIATVDDVANAALFLASDEASYINGVCLPLDGGRTVM